MSYKISDTTIILTRGDSFSAKVGISRSDGTPYIPSKGDKIRFAMKKDYSDVDVLLSKEVPIDTMILSFDPADTKSLQFGNYVYDIQLTDVSGRVDTFITKARLKLTEEVE